MSWLINVSLIHRRHLEMEFLIMSWLSDANEIHYRHCETKIRLAEIRERETQIKAIENCMKSVTDVAKEMVKSGESKEANKLLRETMNQLDNSSKRLNASSEPRRISYYVD